MSKWLLFLGTVLFGLVAWSGVASAQERCPFSVNGTIADGDASQTGRLKNGQPSTCAAPKTVPDLQTPIQERRFDQYTLRNRSMAAACVTIGLTPAATAGAMSSTAYLGAFDPTNPQASYLGDSGNVGAGVTGTYSVNVPALADFVVTVAEVGKGGGDYALTVGDCGAIVVTAVNPNAGSIIGGTAITISGTGFLAGATVTVGGNAATNVVVAGDGTITATTPAGAAGPADVVVTNADATSSTLTGGFVYVAPAETTLTLTTSANPSIVGQSVTFTATATAAVGGPVTGSVTFKVGTTDLGTGTLDGAGVATFTTSSLTIGTHSITATYAGNVTFGAATSGAVSQVVTTGKTMTSIIASANPVVVGNSVTFTVDVAAIAPATGKPTGTVTVSSDGTPIGTGPVTIDALGKATVTSSTFTVGTHSIVATYNGDANFASSVSTPLVLRVDANATDGGTSSSGGSSGTTSGSSSGGTSDAGASSSSGATLVNPPKATGDDDAAGGGCDCNTTGERTSLTSAAIWALAALVVVARRRKR